MPNSRTLLYSPVDHLSLCTDQDSLSPVNLSQQPIYRPANARYAPNSLEPRTQNGLTTDLESRSLAVLNGNLDNLGNGGTGRMSRMKVGILSICDAANSRPDSSLAQHWSSVRIDRQSETKSRLLRSMADREMPRGSSQRDRLLDKRSPGRKVQRARSASPAVQCPHPSRSR
jgi:hypothetical protein